ncbi:hypothetical protein PFLG_00449 [Plasmodium falciparum RAJ116]|uniref:MSP domain-containing protein n=1 Tax=Plasmodium falciparum RAJ116 TaxID=580058 RepID=A0A0L0CSY6_PLAFA|nr:hypothetical protein PFLG_00449 [Plasmodium falciparum RAJ116]
MHQHKYNLFSIIKKDEIFLNHIIKEYGLVCLYFLQKFPVVRYVTFPCENVGSTPLADNFIRKVADRPADQGHYNILCIKYINSKILEIFIFLYNMSIIYIYTDPEYINFHKVLLNSVQKKNIEIKNRSYCDIIWYIDSNSIKDNSFYINPTRGP